MHWVDPRFECMKLHEFAGKYQNNHCIYMNNDRMKPVRNIESIQRPG